MPRLVNRSNFDSPHRRKILPLIMVIFILCIVGILGFFLYHIFSPSPKFLPETEKNSMNKLPSDVKQSLKKQVQSATISATLAVPILMYHYVEYVKDKRDTERQLLDVTPNVFEKQIQILISAGYSFITAKDLGDILDGKEQPPEKPIILTFDDGHWDLDTVVLPILKKYNIRATAYIIPGFIGKNTDSLSIQEMQDVVSSGLIDIGAHTVHHISLKGKLPATVQYEVGESKRMLEQQYNIHVYSFAYPNGSFDKQAIDIVRQDGFTTAASTIAGAQQNNLNRFFLYRIRPGSQTGQTLLKYIKYRESMPQKLSYKN
jgi:peptidoglycan/xylan/chitin deacetylase (PgdA/CDA1 family)